MAFLVRLPIVGQRVMQDPSRIRFAVPITKGSMLERHPGAWEYDPKMARTTKVWAGLAAGDVRRSCAFGSSESYLVHEKPSALRLHLGL